MLLELTARCRAQDEDERLAPQVERDIEVARPLCRLHRAPARGDRALEAPRAHAAAGRSRLCRQLAGLSNEVRQQLGEIRPATLGQAARVPGRDAGRGVDPAGASETPRERLLIAPQARAKTDMLRRQGA
jgi:hypothetical protein